MSRNVIGVVGVAVINTTTCIKSAAWAVAMGRKSKKFENAIKKVERIPFGADP